MGGKRLRISSIALALLLPLGLAFLAAQPGIAYPTPSGTYEGWTAEADLGCANPRHVQIASSGGWLYAVYDQGSNVYFRKTNDLLGLTGWSSAVTLDTSSSNTANNAYIDASGKYVAVPFSEIIDGRSALVILCSWDYVGRGVRAGHRPQAERSERSDSCQVRAGVDPMTPRRRLASDMR